MDTFPSSMLQRLPIAVPQPAANTEWSVAAAGQGWLVKAVSCLLVQGITQTPQPILQIADPGGDILFEIFGSSGAQAASTTCRYSWCPQLPLSAQVGSGANVHSNAPLPDDLFIPGGYTIGTKTLGLGANSQFEAIFVMVVQSG